MHTNFLISIIALLLFARSSSSAQDLPRSASFGARIRDVNDSIKTAFKLPSSAGTLLQMVVPGSSADKAGFVANDVLVSMDGEKIENTNAFLRLLKKHHGGELVQVGYYRKSKLMQVTMTLLPKPMETSADFDILYSSVVSGNNQLRTIITKPRGSGTYPAVLIIGGVGCYSVDNIAATEIQSIKMWVDSLTRNGFATMRVEKPGMGDSKGTPCNECDFNTEKQAFADGLKQLKSLPYVDREKIFIAGFSMGGVIAPLIAQQEEVKGIIVYGTVGRNWLEYEIDNSYRQQVLGGRTADSIDLFMREEYIRLYKLLVEKQSPEQLLKEHPEMSSHLLRYPMKIEYFQQVADINIRELWMNTKARVLALHGASDFVSSGNEHKQIAETVNHYHPGNGTYMEIANSDHWGLFVESELASSLQQQSGLNPEALLISIKWMKANS